MPLRWSIENVENYAEIQDERGSTVTEAIVWATMAIDMGSITAKNYREFAERMQFLVEIGLPLLVKWDDEAGTQEPVTGSELLAEVKRRIGLTTNVTTRTKTQFLKNIVGMKYEDAQRKIAKAKAGTETAFWVA